MPPMPNRDHQDLGLELATWLRTFWAKPRGNRVHQQINVASVGGWPNDYRIPDIVLLTPDRFHIDRNEYFEGAPTVVLEIRSPGDETIEKMPFYATLGVPEVWVVERDTKEPGLWVLKKGAYARQLPDEGGWLRSASTGILLRPEPPGRIALQIAGDPGTRRVLPEQ